MLFITEASLVYTHSFDQTAINQIAVNPIAMIVVILLIWLCRWDFWKYVCSSLPQWLDLQLWHLD